MVECEFRSVQPNVRRIRVLIDTWWNVNKEGIAFSEYIGSSFNRYMVECELYIYRRYIRSDIVLIDTWWNVNMYSPDINLVSIPF